MPTFYDFSATTLSGNTQQLSDHAGKVLVVVNTASLGRLSAQLTGLQQLEQSYHGEPFCVLGFPCRQFGAEEPEEDAGIAECYRARFGVTFALFAKGDVNGADAPAVWHWLTQANGAYPQPVKGNFTKFLIDQQGRVVMRYEPMVEPQEMVPDINRLLHKD